MNATLATRRLDFDCPRCGQRCRIIAAQRDSLIDCDACGLEFLVPFFPTRPGESRGCGTPPPYECVCPVCQNRQRLWEHSCGVQTVCRACRAVFDTPEAPWARWRRPVSKVFTRHDRSYSLHHLMMDVRRWTYSDFMLTPRARRAFEFYCGACGHLQTARAWDIASQTPCRFCDELMIVPAPRRVLRKVSPIVDSDKLYCPQCGQVAVQSDRARRRNSYCDCCGLWF